MMKPLTLPQKNMYETEQFYNGTSICNIGGCLFFRDEYIDIEILKEAVNKLIANSDGIRIRIKNVDNMPMQYVEEYEYERIETIVLPDEWYQFFIEDWMKKPFDISGKLYQFIVVETEERTGLFIKFHHLISDAWSTTLVCTKIIEYYDKLCANFEEQSLSLQDKENIECLCKENLPSYIDYVTKEETYFNSNKYKADEEFWKEKYEIKPSYVTMSPNQKSDFNVEAGRSSFIVPIEETEAISKYCVDNGISPAVLLEAITILYAAKINNSDDVTLCSLVLNRSGTVEKNTIGMFNNILPLTVSINYEETFINFCQRISAEHYKVFRHQKYPLSNIMKFIREKHGKDTELYDIMVSYQNAKVLNSGNISAETNWVFNGSSELGFMLNISDRDNDGRLYFDFDWRKNCFTEDEIEKIYYRFINMVNQVIVNPDILCKNIDIVTYFEKEQILIDFNNTLKEYPRDKCLHYYLEENAKNNPDKVALKFMGKEITYKEFNEKVNALANYIIQKNLKRNSIIGIMFERSFEMLISIYAVIKSGNSYMPIDPHFPKDRIDFMLEDSNTPLVLAQTKWKNIFNDNQNVVDVNEFNFEEYGYENPNAIVVPTDTAYIIYTSGSTGKPKGAMIPHHSVINRIKWMHEKYPLKDGDVILQKTPYTFDVSVWELFWWSMYNGTLEILIPEGHKDPSEIILGIYNGKVTHMHFVPSMLNAFLEYLSVNKGEIKKLVSLKYVFASGEALQVEHVKRFYELLGSNGTTLHNLYGPTECTVDVSYYDCDANNIPRSIPIGKPVDNTQLLILDKNHKLLPIGIVGELYISGALVGKGYLNREELTKEKFVPNLYYDYATMYKTGDLAMWLPDGNIEYCGRTDFQIKIRGLRVELGDIENAILKYDGITQTIVTVFEANGEKNLCVYYTAGKDIDISNLKSSISKVLPDYMVPQYYVKLDKIPTNNNGKADRKKLPIPEINKEERKYIAPKNELEEKIQKCVQEVLKIERLSCDADLFTCGLTSIGVISLITKLSSLGYELRVRDFYECHTIIEIADLFQSMASIVEDYEEDKKEFTKVSDIKNHILPIKDGNAILLTGATGFLGIHIIQELINGTDKNIYCLIRNKEKFERLLKEYTTVDVNNPRIIILFGDITKKDFNLDDNIAKDVKKNISDIIHCAADVTFFCSWERSKEINYTGTCNVLDFAKDSMAKLHHISTMSVSGDILTRQTKDYPEFTEDDLYIGQLYKENVYCYSKYLAEKEIIKAIREDKVNASIYRIANLTWRVSDGKFQENYEANDLYLLTKVMLHYNKVPLELMNENIVLTPVDDSAKAITTLMKVNDNRIYNLYSKESMTIFKYISALTKPNMVPIKKFYDELLNNSDKDPMAQFVSMYIKGVLSNPEKSVVDIINSKTNSILQENGFTWSELGEDYVRRIKNIGGV